VKFTLLITMLMAVGAAACGENPQPPIAERPPVTVAIGTAEISNLAARFEAGGVVRADASAVIASRVMAPIAAVLVRPGDRVRRGAPLVTLDSRELRAHAASASAAWNAAVEAARAAEADTQSAEAAVGLARATYDRINTLVQKKSATPHELDQAASGLAVADAQLKGAEARIAAANASRDAARQALGAADIGVSYTTLTAPFAGVITERHADPGSMAMPGAPLLSLEDVTRFRIEVDLDEARAINVSVGQPVEVRLDTATGDEWTASTVVEVARVDAASHSFVIKVGLASDPALRSGRFGRVRFSGAPRKTLTVPASAVFRRGQLAFVYTVDAESVARLRAVMAGEAAADRVEVLAGLRAGEHVVIAPPVSLTDGARIAAERDHSKAGQP
jgi:RND family efflux transporter MFP subunit